jgi:hypothetical protein
VDAPIRNTVAAIEINTLKGEVEVDHQKINCVLGSIWGAWSVMAKALPAEGETSSARETWR